jgi:predicted GH43/DUF377 family glycosyl hydrolase
MSAAAEGIVVPAEHLVPSAWRQVAAAGPLRTFNPGLLREGDGFLFAYRLVAADGRRRIGLCRLDAQLQVVPGSPLPLSDRVRFPNADAMPEIARQWFADPRLYRFGERLFIYWNSGWHEPRNYQFLQELEPGTLAPIGSARELVLGGAERQKLEKNWTLFSADGAVFAVYTITPHRILRVSLEGSGDVQCRDETSEAWTTEGFPPCHGGLRGGTPPHAVEGGFVSFCHSVHDGPDGYRYRASAYRFAAQPGFAPTHTPKGVIELHNPFGSARLHGRLNPAVADVVYPCGLVRDGDDWLVSHGINDEHCAISRVTAVAFAEHVGERTARSGRDCALQAAQTQR